ncbi:MAG: 3-deoxy-manno-octulosonate cytidylyltransferase [Acidobacteriota bacterium]
MTASGAPAGHADNSVAVVIPARFASTRLPGKPLADIAGHPMIEHVYRRASAARGIGRVIVATDDERISAAVRRFGGEAVMTRPDHESGTDRIAEAAAALDAAIVVNVQGDEPGVDPRSIERAVAPVAEDPALVMSTLGSDLDGPEDLASPHVVKVLVDNSGFALYFTRAAVPFCRDEAPLPDRVRRHIGLYVYRRAFLLALAALPRTPLERTESLEQLRALEYGFRIKVVASLRAPLPVDTPEDLERARRLAAQGLL